MRKSFDDRLNNYIVKPIIRKLQLISLIVMDLVAAAAIIFQGFEGTSVETFSIYSSFIMLICTTVMFVCCIDSGRDSDMSFSWFSTMAQAVGFKAFISIFVLMSINHIEGNQILNSATALIYTLFVFNVSILITGYIRCLTKPKDSSGETYLWVTRICIVINLMVYVYSVVSGKIYAADDQFAIICSFIPGSCAIYALVPTVSCIFCMTYIATASRKYAIKRQRFYYGYVLWYILFSLIQMPVNGLYMSSFADYILIFLFFNDDSLRNSKDLIASEREITNQRISLMRSQIQPHFIFNALNTICYLCRKDPKLAEKATRNFASYLRMNIDSMGNASMVPFNKELEHVKTYLELEKLRFGDKLEVVYDVEFTEFNIPPLALQPVVENAVKHGFGKDKDSIVIRISAKKDDNHVVVKVIDDGVGFDIEKVASDGKVHIGIDNVKQRIEDVAHGTFDVYSLIGTGTMATITIPFEKFMGGGTVNK